MNNRYNAIDLAKFIFAIFIIAFHCEVFKDINDDLYRLFLAVTDIAVPMFFSFSGFLFAEKISHSKTLDAAKHMIKRIFVLWLIWEILYTPFVLWSADNKSVFEILWTNYIWGSYAHLWYLKAKVIAVILVCLMLKSSISDLGKIILICVIYMIGAYLNSYNPFLLEKVFRGFDSTLVTVRNGFFFGMPCFYIGMIAHDKLHYIKEKKHSLIYIIFILMTVGYVLEITMLERPDQMTFFMLPLTFVLTLFIGGMNTKSTYKIFRLLSTYIYVIHFGIMCIVRHFSRAGLDLDTLQTFGIVSLMTIVIAFVLVKLQSHKRFSFIRYLG